ncbi:uncharacterized protein TRIVIDRAFT_206095 [Trichoderma virens Gv29-8]|uniref:F-box domain-containing protein n=1 Tax=Hypocrea virens (strain Gv29-8 / FGSC 10586) TaxID=413071 RepID=G9N960_HYPVG|nr:uncharacterized protein TRIVIDRAFT_206095 [Trichoderma virens Gv29-8]EHK16481.1 hypothetical protein TRIVIDRAFT_206095 [Trichoderma virens Gv29-8]
MGQFLSCILGQSPLPPLLKLPVEIILLIAYQLSSSPESLVALSLTCKTLSFLCNRDAVNLGDESRRHLLLLLEKDLGNKFFYCHVCRQLHHFSQQWDNLNPWDYKCYDYQILNTFRPSYSSLYRLSYIQARLIMNRHFYGSPKGLPLESIPHSAVAANEDGRPPWQQTISARIVGDELFLCITHSLTGRAATLRNVIDKGQSGICQHLAWGRFRRMPELMKPEGDGSNELSPFQACHEVPGYCTMCLTDYVITVERTEDHERIRSGTEVGANGTVTLKPLINGWSITLIAYHQVGQCRDPEDWKWTRLKETPRITLFPHEEHTQHRDMALHPPGAIKEKWQTGET